MLKFPADPNVRISRSGTHFAIYVGAECGQYLQEISKLWDVRVVDRTVTLYPAESKSETTGSFYKVNGSATKAKSWSVRIPVSAGERFSSTQVETDRVLLGVSGIFSIDFTDMPLKNLKSPDDLSETIDLGPLTEEELEHLIDSAEGIDRCEGWADMSLADRKAYLENKFGTEPAVEVVPVPETATVKPDLNGVREAKEYLQIALNDKLIHRIFVDDAGTLQITRQIVSEETL